MKAQGQAMDKMQLIYAILQLRFTNYRTAAGAKAHAKYNQMSVEQLQCVLQKYQNKQGGTK